MHRLANVLGILIEIAVKLLEYNRENKFDDLSIQWLKKNLKIQKENNASCMEPHRNET